MTALRKGTILLADGTDVTRTSPHTLAVLAVDTAMLAKAIAEKAAAEASEAKILAKSNSSAIHEMSELIGKVARNLGDLASTNQTILELMNGLRTEIARFSDRSNSDSSSSGG